jgi:hypothetical protein
MAQNFPDTIILDPYLGGEAKTTDTCSGGRLMNALPHTDGMLFASAWDIGSNSTNLVLTRNAAGDWSLNRTAAGAETYYVRFSLSDIPFLRTGETYNESLFGGSSLQTYNTSAPAKGLKVTDIFVAMNVGVVALTSATLRLGKTVYALEGAAQAAPVQTDIQAATALGSLVVNTAGQYLTQNVPVAAPIFFTDDISQAEIELAVVMANTGTIRIAGIGAHCYFNFD